MYIYIYTTFSTKNYTVYAHVNFMYLYIYILYIQYRCISRTVASDYFSATQNLTQ